MPNLLVKLLGTFLMDSVNSLIQTNKLKAKHKVKLEETKLEAEIERVRQKKENETNWDHIQARNSLSSWKDEFWTIILAAPLIMCFIPKLAPYAFEGFERLESVPEWYIIAVGVAIASAFGFRKMVSYLIKSRRK